MYAAGEIDLPVRIFGQGEDIAQDTRWQEHSHPTHELIWHEAGAGSVTAGTRTWTIAPGVGLWIPAGTPHEGWTPGGTKQRAAHFDVSTPALARTPVAVEITPLLRLLLDRLISENLTDESHEITEAMILDVIAPAERELLLQIPSNPTLAPIVSTVLHSPADDTTLELWASRLKLSSRTITRAFEAETGLGFSRWVATARAQHAVHLLSQGVSIEDVAYVVGYRSVSAFTTAFRRVTGTTPGRFRSEN